MSHHQNHEQSDMLSSSVLADRLRRAGQRVTPQRLVILGALLPSGHLAADDVFARVEQQLPGVNRSTVYRTLELFSELGLVSVTDLGGGARQYELLDQPHHHLICHRCGGAIEMDDALVEPMRQAIRDHYGFAPQVDHLALFGFCRECQNTPLARDGGDDAE